MLDRVKGLMKKLDVLALSFVIAPTFLAALYFGLIASDVYISESRFVVRSPDRPAQTGLGVIFKGLGFSNAGDELAITRDAVLSRDALNVLNKNEAFRNAYTKASISVFDRFNPIGFAGSFEDLYKYYLNRVGIEQNSATSVATLTVRAYTPEDARKFNAQLLSITEQTVNSLNERGRNDLIRYAEQEYDAAKRNARGSAIALSQYRNRKQILDPASQAQVQLQMVSKLQDELINTQSELRMLRNLAPQNPQIPSLQEKASGLSREIQVQLSILAGGQNSLANSSVEFQRLELESQFADKQLAAAMATLEQARNDVRRQQTYVERIVEPNLPDNPLEPRRIRGIFTTFVLGLLAWGIAKMLLAGVKEHSE